MPRGDGTGPEGLGPQTGRAAGYCSGYDVPGYVDNVPAGRGGRRGLGRGRGRGLGRGRGRGLGPGRGYAQRNYNRSAVNNNQAAESETEYLEREKSALKDELNAVENRLEQLKEDEE